MTEPPKFKPQDQVQFQYGGPWMTVRSIAGDDVTCGWSDEKKKSIEEAFKASDLRHAPHWRAFDFG